MGFLGISRAIESRSNEFFFHSKFWFPSSRTEIDEIQISHGRPIFLPFFVMAWIFSIFVVHMTNFIMGIWKIWPPGHFEGFFQLKSRSGFSSSKIWSKLAIFHTISLPNIKNYWKNVNYHLNFSKVNPRHHKYSQNNKNQAEEIVTKISQSYGKPIQVILITLLRL